MWWNKDNATTPSPFNTGTADDELGLFYKRQSCTQCDDDCCILLEGVNEPIILEASESCIMLEGCDEELDIYYLRAITS